MYAAGYDIRSLRTARRSTGAGHIGRWVIVLSVCWLATVGLAKVAYGGAAPADVTVVVQPGDTLWSIATDHYPADDVRARVADIERLNGLQGPLIEVGETLRLPA